MEGRVLTGLIQEEFLADHPIEVEETNWDVEAWPD
jgi:hypothetical protein